MSFHSFAAFVSMGGHGQFVWSAYAVGLAVTVFNVVRPIMLKRRNMDRLRRQLDNEQVQ